MTTLEELDKKISILKENLEKLNQDNMDQKTKLQAQLVIISQCEEVLNDEKLLLNYDFVKAIDLIENYNYSIDNLSEIIGDIKNALLVRKQLGLTKEEMPLEENQVKTFNDFIAGLRQIKNQLEIKIQALIESEEEKQKIKNLENLKKVLQSNGKQYVTHDMFKTFFEEFNLLEMPLDEVQGLLEGFYQTRNLVNPQKVRSVSLAKIIDLYNEFLNPSKMEKLEGLIEEHKVEIRTNINLDNTRAILQFFKDNNLLKRFRNTALLKVSLYGNYFYIKNVVFPKMQAKGELLDAYFENEVASIWIKQEKSDNYRSRPFRVMRIRNKDKTVHSLYSSCNMVSYDEFWQNVEILKANHKLFEGSIDVEDIGANLTLQILPTWILKKNIELCKIFKINNFQNIPSSCIEKGDIENKIHIAIELGLLNPPMSEKFLELDKKIVRNTEFQQNIKKKKKFNQSIRNYFHRYPSILSIKTINEYAYLTYKLQNLGYENFYNGFFSALKAGQSNTSFITNEERKVLTDKSKLDDLIMDSFTKEWYSDLIENFDTYDNVIDMYKEELKDSEYFDKNILNDDLIKELENKNAVYDLIEENGQLVNVKNDYTYLFGGRIISRYKVLRNASILKKVYKELDQEMLLTAIVRNSFIDNDTFQLIKAQIMDTRRREK